MDAALITREAIRGELAASRLASPDLFGTLSQANRRQPTRNPAWSATCCTTSVASLELLPREVARARQGKGLYTLPRFMRDSLSSRLTRWEARRQSLTTITRRYDEPYAAVLRTIDEVRDDELRRSARFWGEGFSWTLRASSAPRPDMSLSMVATSPQRSPGSRVVRPPHGRRALPGEGRTDVSGELANTDGNAVTLQRAIGIP
jgi:hypothetical protein